MRSCFREVCIGCFQRGGKLQRLAAFGCALQIFFFKYLPHTVYFSSPGGGGGIPVLSFFSCTCMYKYIQSTHKKEVKGSGRSRLFSGFALLAGVILIWICGVNFINLSRFLRWMNLRRILRLGPFSVPKCVAHLFIYIFRR